MTTKELEEELKRRKTKYNIRVAGTVFALDLDEMEEIFAQIKPHVLPKPVQLFRGLDEVMDTVFGKTNR